MAFWDRRFRLKSQLDALSEKETKASHLFLNLHFALYKFIQLEELPIRKSVLNGNS